MTAGAIQTRRVGWSVLAFLVPLLVLSMADARSASLKDRPSTFVRVDSAPVSSLRKVNVAGSLEIRGADSSFTRQQAPLSVFRAAEVEPGRVDLTKRLLGELKARETERQAIVVDLPADVLFDFDRSDLRPDARAPLEKAAELLRSYPTAPVSILGHTDGKGSDAYNDALSVRRAQAVAARLSGGDATGRRFEVQGRGKREPLAPNARPDGTDDPEGRQRNRRVAIVIQPSPKS